jgi:type 1 glutamine amidotransferase
MIHRRLLQAWCLALACAFFSKAAPPARIALIAGPITGHPKEAHEYEKSVVLLKRLLETSPDLTGRVSVDAFFNGWPSEPAALDAADTIVMIGDGGDHREQDHPLYVGDRREQLARQAARGCGVVFIHWSVFHPSRFHDQVTDWVGGYFDYETGPGANHWYSAIQFWNASARPAEDSPITRGVHPWTAQEEFYYRIKFRGTDPALGPTSDPRLKPVLFTRPPNETNDFTVAWSVERADGGRGFATSGGHYFANYWQPDWRKLILNAIAWTAHIDPPAGGIRSEPMDRYDVMIVTGANHPAHAWVETTAALLTAIEQDPRAKVRVIEDPERLAESATLDGVKLVVWNYVNWERHGLGDAAKRALLKHAENGGGLEFVHFGASAFHPSLPGTAPGDAWPEFYERLARRVWEHRAPAPSSHDTYGPFRVAPVPATTPAILAGLPPFDTVDELYFNQAGSEPISILATAPCRGTGREEPVAWAYDLGRAHVFQTTLGHSAESVRRAASLIRRGAAWAAGAPALVYDPPTDRLEKVLWREGSPWKPHPVAAATPATTTTKTTSVLAAEPSTPAPLTAANTPKAATAGHEPETQKEGDWVDNRWQQTEVGPFLATYLGLPSGTVARGFAVKVGPNRDATMAYDTGSGALVAGWRGGFLKFDAARFGLLAPPKPAAEPEFSLREEHPWGARPFRFTGHHIKGERVAFSWNIGGVPALESPTACPAAGGWAWIRELEIGPDAASGVCALGVAGGFKPRPATPDGVWAVEKINGDMAELVAVAGGAAGRIDGDRIAAAWPPSDHSIRFNAVRWRGPAARTAEFLAWLAAQPQEELSPLTQPGEGRWGPPLQTVGERGPDTGVLAVDTLTPPFNNPWKALMFGAGVDFDDEGAFYYCTIHGDVWRVTGVDDSLANLRWTRFATGLFQPLGLRVRNNEVFVLGRDRITRLFDYNRDGEADYYETFHDGIETSPNGHQYVTSLELDDAGNFYYADPVGVHRITPDGRGTELLATGLRNPNGMGVKPDGTVITVAPQQGEWTPSSVIFEVHRGDYYGYGGPKASDRRPLGYDSPLCWIPHRIDNSSGGQVWTPPGSWDALGDHCLHLLWGRCGLMVVLRDATRSRAQGGVTMLPAKFSSGVDRAVFRKADQSLYVAGSTGWQTSATRDGCLQRVRWTGKPWRGLTGWRARPDGIEITFAKPLSKASAEDTGGYGAKRWSYKYAAQYGSEDWSLEHPEMRGRDTVNLIGATLLSDQKTVFLAFEHVAPSMQLEIKFHLETSDGQPVSGEAWFTVNETKP